MVTFESPEFRAALERALKIGENILWESPDPLPEIEEWDAAEPEGDEPRHFEPSTVIDVRTHGSDENFEMRCDQFIGIMNEVASAKLSDDWICQTPVRSLFRVEPVNEIARGLVHGSIRDTATPEEAGIGVECAEHIRRFCTTTTERDNQRIWVSMTSGLTMFGLTSMADSGWDEDFEEYHFTPHEIFVEVRSAVALSLEVARDVYAAYVFELAASFCAEFRRAQRPTYEDFYVDEDSAPASLCLRPLIKGNGVGELCRLYCKLIDTDDAEFQILYAAKILEYVSQTVIRKTAHESLRGKLLSPTALAPDARFLSELQSIAGKSQKMFSDDREAIKQTVLECCEPTELARHAPSFLGEFRARGFAGDEQKQRHALAKFAQCLYSTRNAIAHAKANYSATGNECPLDLYPEFAECAKFAAQQVVRWFSGLSDAVRIVAD